MTCKEVHSSFENPLLIDTERNNYTAAIAEHVVSCTECCQFVELQREIGRSLRIVRESAPEVPAELDRSVIASFHRYSADLVNSASSSELRKSRAFFLSTAAGALTLVALVLIAILVLSHEKYIPNPQLRPAQSAAIPLAPSTDRDPPIKLAAKKKGAHAIARRRLRKPEEVPSTAPDTPFTVGFDSLMYCDELSCGGALEMIRVRLPDSVAQLTPNSAQANDMVLVDVLVGSDGIARGIRIVQ